jgi:hypothetical protein
MDKQIKKSKSTTSDFSDSDLIKAEINHMDMVKTLNNLNDNEIENKRCNLSDSLNAKQSDDEDDDVALLDVNLKLN